MAKPPPTTGAGISSTPAVRETARSAPEIALSGARSSRSPAVSAQRSLPSGYSHSIVAGGFDVTSRTTRFTPGISLTILLEISSIRS
jgi:hypothetical protein